MAFNRFHIRVILYLFLLLGWMVLGVYLAVYHHSWLSAGLVTVAWLFTLVALFRFLTRSHRSLTRFLQAVEHRDPSVSFSEDEAGAEWRELHRAMNELLRHWREARIEKETQHQFFLTLIRTVPTGLLVRDHAGGIEVMNPAFQDLLALPGVNHWERLQRIWPDGTEFLDKVRPGESVLYEQKKAAKTNVFSVRRTTVRTRQQQWDAWIVHNIQNELDLREIDAWHKLIRVLTHEIMNSVTPIASLAETVSMLLEDEEQSLKPVATLSDETLEDVHLSARTIQKRCAGLLQFVADYRQMVRLPEPRVEDLQMQEFLERFEHLVKPLVSGEGIRWSCEVHPADLSLTADTRLLEQVLLNLVTNAREAVAETTDPAIQVKASKRLGQVRIEVSDNGPGIASEHTEQVFIPFFSTKENGSGIGLSLARNVMRMHRGHIHFVSEPGSTTFVLEFPEHYDPDR